MEIAFFFYSGMTALDTIGPHEVLSRLPGAVVRRVAKQSGMVKTDSGIELKAEYGFNQVSRADVLVVPGAESATAMRDEPEILAWIRDVDAATTWTTSVCTGSLILGAAGLLTGLKATTHWAAHDRLLSFGAEPTRLRVVEAGKVITAAGVSAGIDMALVLAAKIAGQAVSRSLQLESSLILFRHSIQARLTKPRPPSFRESQPDSGQNFNTLTPNRVAAE